MRIPFDQALEGFRRFLRDQGWSDDLLWLSRDRVTGHRRRFWILRPEELSDPQPSKQFYEETRQTDSSIRIDGLCQIGDKTLAYVQDYGGDSRFLNYGIHTGEIQIRSLTSRFQLVFLRALNILRGLSPFLKHTAITKNCRTRRRSAQNEMTNLRKHPRLLLFAVLMPIPMILSVDLKEPFGGLVFFGAFELPPK